MITVFFEESSEKQTLRAIVRFLASFPSKIVEVKKEGSLDDLTREDYLASIPFNRRPVTISKSFRKNYGKI